MFSSAIGSEPILVRAMVHILNDLYMACFPGMKTCQYFEVKVAIMIYINKHLLIRSSHMSGADSDKRAGSAPKPAVS
jgi:hypothetical protein